MKKKEALDHIREKRGFVPSVSFFELFKDGDDVPQHIIDYFTTIPLRGSGSFMVVGSELAKKLNEIGKPR